MNSNLKSFKFLIVVLPFTFLLLNLSCAVRHAATAVTADILTKGMVEVETEQDTFVAKETALPLLKIVEVLHMGNPADKKFLGLLTKVYGNYAFGFAELEAMKCHPPLPSGERAGVRGCSDDWTARAKRFYFKGMNYGIKTLSSGSTNIANMPISKVEKYLKGYSKTAAADLFWTAFAWGSYINMNRDDIAVTADLPRVQALVDRVIAVDPEFMCGVAHAFKGALLVANPFLTGSKPETAKPYFEKAIGMCDGNFLMTKVMYAEWYQKAVGDKAGFKKTLDDVIAADGSKLPPHRLANELAKERAALLMKLK